MSGYDVGRRIVVTDQGVAFDGTLADLAITRSDYDFKDRDRVTVRLVVKRFDGDRTTAEMKLANLPLEYLVEREAASPVGVPEGGEPRA